MVVYVEYVIAENFIIDFFLLKTAFYLSGAKSGKIMRIISAVSGGAFALFISFFALPQAFVSIIKIVFGLCLVFIAGRFASVKEFYVTATFFFALSFAVGGAISGIYSLLGVNAENLTAFTVIPVCAFCALTKKLFAHFKRRAADSSKIVKAEITVGGITLKCRGFFDTGNGLFCGDSPVIVCGRRFFNGFFKQGFKLPPFSDFSFFTVSGKDTMKTVKTEKVLIYIADEPNIFYNVTLAIAKAGVGTGYDVILHPALKGEKNENQSDFEIKKVS